MRKYSYLLLFFLTIFLFFCQTYKPGKSNSTSANAADQASTATNQIDFNVSPVVSPAASISKMKVEEGFEVKLVAAEPFVNSPVALTFDARGRIWVVEMQGYMPDTIGTGEDIPVGKIVILEDKNKDGVADARKVFLDSLLLPRAISLVENGILVAEPPRLWYYEIENDKPGKRVLVDEKYAEGGNVEHQPNGLLRALDNWIYNAKSSKRYRKRGDKWEMEQTHFRGQWGITQDNSGRLYYNTNTENLLGDYFSPGFGANNQNQRNVAGFNEKVVADNKVYPIRPTPAVNRGYMEGILDKNKKLVNFTAACAPQVYRGGLFGSNYINNVFVAEPSANLIKRNVLVENGYLVTGRQAYQEKEFVASVDERFRPVSLYNAPDGALYVVDMYRGIIQHKTYLTTYLKNEIGKRALTQPLAYGRIYKVVPKHKKAKVTTLPNNPLKLVKLLGQTNGWVRDKAQQMLIDGKYTQAVPALQAALNKTNNPLLVIHALWTLEGLGALHTQEVITLLQQQTWPLRMQALSAIPSVLNKDSYAQLVPVLNSLIQQQDTLAAPYVAFIAKSIETYNKAVGLDLLQKVAAQFPENKYVADAVISNLKGQEESFEKELTALLPNKNNILHKRLRSVISNIRDAEANRDPQVLIKAYPKGAALFRSVCQTCHGADGNGVKALAPPLNQSEWVTGNQEKLISIVLFGLTGPIKVNNHLYEAPEINGDMPGIGYNQELSNEDIAQLLSYIRKSWRNNAENIKAEDVASVRQKLKGRQKAFTMPELEKSK